MKHTILNKPGMRLLEKRPQVGRRGFLRSGGVAAIGVAVVPVSSLAQASTALYAQSFGTLRADIGKTLIRMARDIFPHDKLADEFYVQSQVPYDSHNMGTNRMSANARDGVVNKWGRTHDVKNLFISDGSQFTSSSAANPTLTIVALAIRQAEYIAGAMKRKEI